LDWKSHNGAVGIPCNFETTSGLDRSGVGADKDVGSLSSLVFVRIAERPCLTVFVLVLVDLVIRNALFRSHAVAALVDL
jgi:hypothetical protein